MVPREANLLAGVIPLLLHEPKTTGVAVDREKPPNSPLEHQDACRFHFTKKPQQIRYSKTTESQPRGEKEAVAAGTRRR
jgi:hypothetical protein